MARVKGGYLGGIYDIPKKQPLDSRMLVTKRVDLINPAVWKTNGSTTGESGHYNGMIVAVNSDGVYNGIYYLTDRNAITDGNYGAYKDALAAGNDVEAYFTMWMKLGTLADLAIVEEKIKQLATEIQPTLNLVPVDGTLVISDIPDGKAIGVAIAPVQNNALVAVDGGLFVPTHTAGDGISIENNKISVKLADETHGLVAVNGALGVNLATRKSDGAMSAQDKLTVDSVPYVYKSKKYEISGAPAGTLVDYRDREIRVMCPADTKFVKQSVGATGNENMYYMSFKAYAPIGAVSFKEGDRGVIVDEMHTFDEAFSGVDEFGRKYSVCWLALASYNQVSDTWTYFGKNSTEFKYIGWDYVVEWFDKTGTKIGFDSIRINLSNESCHKNNKPYYMASYATSSEVAALGEVVLDLKQSCSWSDI